MGLRPLFARTQAIKWPANTPGPLSRRSTYLERRTRPASTQHNFRNRDRNGRKMIRRITLLAVAALIVLALSAPVAFAAPVLPDDCSKVKGKIVCITVVKARTRKGSSTKPLPRPPRATSRTSVLSRRAWVPRRSATGQAERRSALRASSSPRLHRSLGPGLYKEPRPLLCPQKHRRSCLPLSSLSSSLARHP